MARLLIVALMLSHVKISVGLDWNTALMPNHVQSVLPRALFAAELRRTPKNFVGLKNSDSPSTMHPLCITQHCGWQFARAMIDVTFLKEIKCMQGCEHFWHEDHTPEKFSYQNCSTICARTYEGEKGDAFMSCAMSNGCIEFGHLDVQCPKEKFTQNIEASSSLASLSGEFWQHYGYNKIYDCYPCQHIHENKLVNNDTFCHQTVRPDGTPVASPCFSYHYSYDVFSETGLINEEQTWQLPGPKELAPGQPIDIYYEYLGTMHNETWYIQKTGDRYVALSYCSYMNGWTNIGGIVWAKVGKVADDEKLTQQELAEIDAAYAKVDQKFADFCVDKHGTKQCSKEAHFRQPIVTMPTLV